MVFQSVVYSFFYKWHRRTGIIKLACFSDAADVPWFLSARKGEWWYWYSSANTLQIHTWLVCVITVHALFSFCNLHTILMKSQRVFCNTICWIVIAFSTGLISLGARIRNITRNYIWIGNDNDGVWMKSNRCGYYSICFSCPLNGCMQKLETMVNP